METSTTGGTRDDDTKANVAAGSSPARTTTRTRPRRWITYGIVGAAVVTALAALGARRPAAGRVIGSDGALEGPTFRQPPVTRTIAARTPVAPVPTKRPQVEVVFALDTTSSMTGLLEGAKRKIWSIAGFIAKGQPAPDLRVGLVAYRDIGDAYVTKVFDLDADLDRVYRRLRQFQAEGGGDGPEHVGRGLHDAVHKMSWSPAADQDVLRLIYLVGDAPAHTDYDDGFSFTKAARAAASKAIQVHAIRCGNDETTAEQWRTVASIGKGQFLTIGHDGGMREHRTPYDEELARLDDEVSATVVAYGAKGKEARLAVEGAAGAPLAVKAARASFMATRKAAVAGDGDLVGGVASGLIALDKVPAADLPADLRLLAPAEQKAKIAKLAEDRKKSQARIEELSRKRDEYLATAERASARPAPTAGGRLAGPTGVAGLAPPPSPSSFDAEVAKTVVSGAKRIGVVY